MTDDTESRPALPAGWAWATLGELGSWTGGGTPSKDRKEYWDGGTVPWVSPKDMKSDYVGKEAERITEAAIANSAAKKIDAGSVVVVVRSGILRHTFPVSISDCEIALNQDLRAITPFDGVVSRFLQFYLRSRNNRLLRECSKDGTTVNSIEISSLTSFPVPLAPTSEQRRIVDRISALFGEIEAGEQELEEAHKGLASLRRAVLKAAMTGELTQSWRGANPPKEFGANLLRRILAERRTRWEQAELAKLKARGQKPKSDTWKARYAEPLPPDTEKLAELPEGWVWTSIGQLFRVFVGATPSRAEPGYWNGSTPWVSSGEVAFCRISDTRERITKRGLENSSTRLHPAGTVLMAMIGDGKTRGQAAILDIPACNSQNSAAIYVSETPIPSEYIYYLLLYLYEQNRRMSAGGNQKALNSEKVKSICIPLPPLAEIRSIVELISEQLASVDELNAGLRSAASDSIRLRQSILAAAFSGKLVPQDPNDEPAETLLARIRATKADAPTKRRGRSAKAAAASSEAPKRRGRPPKAAAVTDAPKRPRGRPRKTPAKESQA